MTDRKNDLASRLNRRVVLQFPARIANGKGGFTKSWTSTPAFAEMLPLRGGEAVEHNLLNAKQLWRVTIRYRPDVTTECRIIHDGRELNIRTSEDIDGRRRELVMTCESGIMT